MLKSIGLPELLVILVVAMLLFGGKKIPELAKGLGQGIRNFKESVKDEPACALPTTRSSRKGFLAPLAVWSAASIGNVTQAWQAKLNPA